MNSPRRSRRSDPVIRLFFIPILGLSLLTFACNGSPNFDLACDGNIDDSVFINIVDDETSEELCCPTTLRINGRTISESDGGVVADGCECIWRETGQKAFIVLTEDYVTLLADNLFEIEVAGYEPWQTEDYVPCVCVPHVEFTARLTPEVDP